MLSSELPDNPRDVCAGRKKFAVTLEASEVRVGVSGAVGPVHCRGQEPDNSESFVIPGCGAVSPRMQRLGNQFGGQFLDNLLANGTYLSLGQKVGDYAMGT